MKRFLFLLLLSRSLCADETKLFELLYKSVSKTADGIEKTITFFESLFYEPGDSEGCGEYFRRERNLAVDTTETASSDKSKSPRRASIVSDKVKTKIGAIIATATLIGILKYSLDLWREKQEREEREKAEAKKRAVTPLLTPEQQLHQKLRDLGFSQRAIAMIKRHPQLAQAYDYLPHDVHAADMQRHIVKQTNNLGRLYVCSATLDGAAEVADLGMSFSAVASTFNRDGYTAQAKVAITGTKFAYGFLKGAVNAARQKGKSALWCLNNLDKVGKNVQNAAANLRNGICNIADTIASDPEGLLDGGIEQCQSFCGAIARDPIGAVHTVGYTVRALCQETLTRIQVYCATTTEEEFGEDLGHAVADAIIWFAIGRVTGIAGKAVATRTTRALKKLGKYGKTVAKKVGNRAKNSKLVKGINKIREARNKFAKYANFASETKLKDHFLKHGARMGTNSMEEYLSLARHVIRDGIKVKYNYNNKSTIGFLKFMTTSSKGEPKFAFVGTNSKGFITTLHTKSGKRLWSTINGNSFDNIIRPCL